ncbi:FMN-dependent NADH-azoreductase [Microseira wollei]|uniref:FMN dependent NADH:quinone oxidoreductase n=1 Tax=Microseira wollei NIES-4236 TaxID=2530354 RepID=A0AAV3X9T3_9CYAN|nr:FMN-dependent NADH-azoreductase [Microseira wollei]GET36102.1 NAD(P)H dehydrogenase (quinone) [Microseira wollei NIES-4236]
MANILHIDSSPRGDRSHSRTLTGEFITAWKSAHPNDNVTYRDIGRSPVPHVDEPWIAASFTPPEDLTPELKAAIQISDELIDEFLTCDRYILGSPMHNFGITSTLKAYFDQIVRVGRTFAVTENGYEGLVKNKKALIITSRGGSYPPGSPMAQFDFQEPYIRAIFNFMGIADISFIHADNISMGDDARQQSFAAARNAIKTIVDTW